MNEHRAIRELLILAAAGVLDTDEQIRVTQHLAGCPECAAELDSWRQLAGALQRVPTPQPPAGLVERTQARVANETALQGARAWNRTVLVFLVVFSWIVTAISWPLVRLISSSVAGLFDLQLTNFGIGVTGYAVMMLLPTAVATTLLAARYRDERITI